jgi:hypothetical protein
MCEIFLTNQFFNFYRLDIRSPHTYHQHDGYVIVYNFRKPSAQLVGDGRFSFEGTPQQYRDILKYEKETDWIYRSEKLLTHLNSALEVLKTTPERVDFLTETCLSISLALLGRERLDHLRIELDRIEEEE